MAYALVVMLWASQHGVAIEHIPMQTEAACDAARQATLLAFDYVEEKRPWSTGSRQVKAICVRTRYGDQ